MSIRSFAALAKQCKCLDIKFIALPDGRVTILMIPSANETQDHPALSTPLKLEGTIDELEAGLPGVLEGYSASRAGLAESLADAQTIMAAAKKDVEASSVAKLQAKSPAARVARPTPSKGPGPKRNDVDENHHDDDDDDDDVGVGPNVGTGASGPVLDANVPLQVEPATAPAQNLNLFA